MKRINNTYLALSFLCISLSTLASDGNTIDDIFKKTLAYQYDEYEFQEKIEEYIDTKKDPNSTSTDGQTLLHLAAQIDSDSAIRYLIKNKADVTIQDANGSTALHLAAGRRNEAAIQELMEGGAQQCVLTQDKKGKTPLHWSGGKCAETAKLLLCLRSKNRTIINIQDNEDSTALHFAASNGKFSVLNLLLEQGADPNLQDKTKGRTALHWVQRMTVGSVYKGGEQIEREAAYSMLELLLNYEADPTIKDNTGRSVIDWAIRLGKVKERDLFKDYLE